MTPTSTHPARAVRRSAAPRAPRRKSGPARSRRIPAASAHGGAVAVPTPFGRRVARRAVRVGDARLLDRLVRGRAWIAIVAVGLLGIVFMQVSMLRLNAGISRAVTAAETLQRQNSTLRADISELDSGERIQNTAAGLGMVMPEAGKVHYLDARRADGRAAARGVRAPSATATATVAAAGEVAQRDPAGAAAPQQTAAAPQQTAATPEQTATAAGQTAAAPAQATPAATGPPPPAGQIVPAPQSTATAPAATAPATTAPATAPPTAPEGGTAAPQGG
jgi:cell division protein FtsL